MHSTFSLWLIPDFSSRQHANLRATIKRLSHTFKTVEFDPHVTLLGGIEQTREVVLARAKRFADAQSPLDIRFGAIRSKQKNPMQIFFADVELSEELKDAHIAVSELMFGPRKFNYTPHLSLVYGDLNDEHVAVLLDEVVHTTFVPENNNFISWGVSVWHTPTLDVKDWSEEQHFKFRIK